MKENKKMERLAYIAGIIDGDGSISLTKRNILPSPLYYPEVQLANQNKNLIHYFYDEFGGYKYCRKSWKGKNGSMRKDSWQWKLDKRRCKSFLEKIMPFLKLKKERANYLLKYIDENPFKRGIRLTPEILRKREESYIKMIRLNIEKDINKTSPGKRRKTPVNDPIFWSYLGGLMDSDGSFSIKRETKNIVNSFKYLPIISLTMTDIRGLSYIVQNCPYGTLRLYKAKATKYGFNYRFSIHSHEECSPFIERCLPYLKLKKNSAEVLYKFCKQKKKTKYCRAGVPLEESAFREQCYCKLIDANNGVYKSPLIDLEVLQLDDRGQDASQAERLNRETSQ